MATNLHLRSLHTTRWSLVRRANGGGAALDEWVGSCWYPLYTWARYKGWSHEDSADAVQDFLSKICQKELLANLDPAKGKLRSWLLASFGNHLSSIHTSRTRRKRGGGRNTLDIDWSIVEKEHHTAFIGGLSPEQAYSRAWAIALMEEALRRLCVHYENTGRKNLFDVLLPALEGRPEGTTFDKMSSGLSMSGTALRQATVRFRQRYKMFLLEVAGERLGITDEALLHQELRGIFHE